MSVFSPVCPLPPDGVGYVHSPNVRGTSDIIWSSISILLLSTWSLLHLNVPSHIEGSALSKRKRIQRNLYLTWRKVKWMLLTMFAPECLLGSAFAGYISAWRSEKDMLRFAAEDDVEWSLMHAHLANMGGFVVRFDTPRPKEFMIPAYLNLAALQGNVWILDARQLFIARKTGIISSLPALREADIQDRTKSDGAVKLLALTQIAWLILQVIMRSKEHHPSTQLEITTIAFSACAFLTYLLSFAVPQDISQPVTLQAARYPTPAEALLLANQGPAPWFDGVVLERWSWGRRGYWMPDTALHYVGSDLMGVKLHRFGPFWGGSAVGGLVLGAVHAVAWQMVFPSDWERMAWRIAAISTAAIPPVYAVVQSMSAAVFMGIAAAVTWIYVSTWYTTLTFVSTVAYFGVRLFVLVEVVRSMAFLPPGAFVANWSANIPHLG
ncbi:hypothetical protein EJ06DRAFT_479696 [Trichodelitschia bisporula]|uniref:Uncharacterized protein n=1 Tax=Trichodelitschia bisporula TaxID=703511 RepID=A0A6G1HSP8_9PEZI|nr:hypothetical protein EJ06DRAFT_479696 [Trichodelitschia bisporula]